MPTPDRKLITREILLGFWKVHILYHAAEQPVIGRWVLGELRRHGYDISPGTLYPLLKRMERNGWLKCEVDSRGGPTARRYYHLTREGSAVLDVVTRMVGELHDEITQERHHQKEAPTKRASGGSLARKNGLRGRRSIR